MILTKYWCRTKCLHNNSKDEIFIQVFAHRNDDKEIYPLAVEEIAKAQIKDKAIQKVKDSMIINQLKIFMCYAKMNVW